MPSSPDCIMPFDTNFKRKETHLQFKCDRTNNWNLTLASQVHCQRKNVEMLHATWCRESEKCIASFLPSRNSPNIQRCWRNWVMMWWWSCNSPCGDVLSRVWLCRRSNPLILIVFFGLPFLTRPRDPLFGCAVARVCCIMGIGLLPARGNLRRSFFGWRALLLPPSITDTENTVSSQSWGEFRVV